MKSVAKEYDVVPATIKRRLVQYEKEQAEKNTKE